MIFRTGTESVSDIVMMADNSGYSHVGMLVGGPDEWSVVHATPEEVEGEGNRVVIHSLAFYTAPERSSFHKVYAVTATQAQRDIAVHWAYSQLGQPFTLLDPEGVYCTTLIWKAWLDAGIDLQVKFVKASLPLISDLELLFPSGLINSPLVYPVNP